MGVNEIKIRVRLVVSIKSSSKSKLKKGTIKIKEDYTFIAKGKLKDSHKKCSQSMVLLQLGDTSMPMAQITTNGHADVCGLHFHLSPSLFLWSMLSPPPRILLRSMVLLQPGTC
jgi:hypothetical protein